MRLLPGAATLPSPSFAGRRRTGMRGAAARRGMHTCARLLETRQTPVAPSTTAAATTAVVCSGEAPRGGYEAARRRFAEVMQVRPFSFEEVLVRAGKASAELPPSEAHSLRGVPSSAYDEPVDAAAAHRRSERLPGAIYDGMTPLTGDTKSTECVSLSSTTSSLPHAKGAVRPSSTQPPSLLQLLRAVERPLLKHVALLRRYRNRTVSVRATEKLEEGTGAVYSSKGTEPSLRATPSPVPAMLTAFLPKMLSAVVERSIRYAHPAGSSPVVSAEFTWTEFHPLLAEEIVSLQWDRAAAVHAITTVLQLPMMQKDLRMALWASAQREHRSLVAAVDALATMVTEDAPPSEASERFVVVETNGRSRVPLRVPLQQLKDDLFTFSEALFFSRHPPSVSFRAVHPRDRRSRVEEEKVENVRCKSLRSSELFCFSTSHSAVAALFGERPPSDIFASAHTVQGAGRSPLCDQRSSSKPASALTTAPNVTGQLWLLLSEMVRLRYLVGYLLQLETVLYDARLATEKPKPCHDRGLASDRGEDTSATPNFQAIAEARCAVSLLHFLDVRLHTRLQPRQHNARFLRKVQVTLRTGSSTKVKDAMNPLEVDSHAGTAATATAHARLTLPEPKHPSVQALFNAFSKAQRTSLTERQSEATVSMPCSKHLSSLGERSSSQETNVSALDEAAPLRKHSAFPEAVTKPCRLSNVDEGFLDSILASAPPSRRAPFAPNQQL